MQTMNPADDDAMGGCVLTIMTNNLLWSKFKNSVGRQQAANNSTAKFVQKAYFWLLLAS
jgi:hypothetical protein